MKLPKKRRSLHRLTSGFTLIRTRLRRNLDSSELRTRLRRNLVNAHGFTLIELLVVIMIMGLLFGFGYANYRGFQRRQQLEGVVREFKTNLRLAQQLALTGKKEAECATLEGYRVRRVGNSYEIGAVCDGSEACNNTPSYCIKTVQMPPNISINAFLVVPLGPGNQFRFLVLSKGVDSSATVTFTHTATGDTRSVEITPSGEIY